MADFEIERPSVDVQPIQPTYNINTPSFTIEINGSTPGQRGEQGPPGQDGRDGVDGINGQDGQDGVGVESIEQTSTSHESGGTNIITATLTDGSQSFFEIMNGEAGASGGMETLTSPVTISNLTDGFYRLPPNCVLEEMGETINGNGLLCVTHRDEDGFSIVTFYIIEDDNNITLHYDLDPNYPSIELDADTKIMYGEVSDELGDATWNTIRYKDLLKNTDVVNNLTSTSTTRPLSAAQGKALKDLLDALATVANTGDYDDLINKPTIPTVNDATLTIQKNGSNLGTFTANASTNKTINVTVPTKVSDITNDSGFVTSTNVGNTITATGYSTKIDANLGTIDIINYIKRYGGTNSAYINSGAVVHKDSNDVLDTLDNVIDSKQETLVSGTNIKTINNQSLLGSGNIDVSGGGGTATDVQINGTSIVVSDVANILTETAYDSSTNKIATMSDIPDTSDFIDKDVNNLTNYSLTTNIQTNKNLTKGIEYIVGTQNTATNAWTGTSTDTGCSSGNIYTGKVIIYHLPIAGTSSAATLNLTLPDGTTTGAKNIYRQASSTVTTTFAADCDILMVYNGTQWKVNAYVDTTNSNSIGYQIRTDKSIYVNGASTSIYRYQLLVQTENGLEPFTSTSNKTETTKTQLSPKYLPGGDIRYYSSTTEITSGSDITSGSLWMQYHLDLRYSFNITSTTLTAKKPVYMKMSVNADGTLSPVYSALSGGHPLTQTLPTTADGYVYLHLGTAYSGYQLQLEIIHPMYEYKNGKLREYVDATGGTITETDPVFSASAAYGISSSDITNWNNKSITDLSSTVILNDIDSGIYRLAKGTVLKYKESDDDSNPTTLTTVNKSALMMFNIKVDSGYPLFSYIILQDDHDGTYSSMDNTFELDAGSNSHIMSGCMSPYTGDIWNEKDLYINNILDLNDVVDNLTSSYTTRPLSAKQGKVLKDTIDNLSIPKIFYVSNSDTTYTYSQISGLIQDGYEIILHTSDATNDARFVPLSFLNQNVMNFNMLDYDDTTQYQFNFNQNEWFKDVEGLAYSSDIHNATITIQKNGTNVDSFTTNASSNKSINITVPTSTSDLTNNSGFITNSVNNLTNYTLTSSLATVATSGSYNDLSNKPTIPTITLSTTTWIDNLF